MEGLKKNLNLYGLTMIAVGACIGSGIFLTPGQVVENVPNHLLVILVWILGGIVALTGALTFAELGSMFPKSGGVYVYLKEAFGPLAGFLYGWVILLVINTGALAALGMAFAEYLNYFIDLNQNAKVIIAISTVAILTLINVLGVDISQIFANVFTGLKLIGILVIILVGFLFTGEGNQDLVLNLNEKPDHVVTGMLLALIGVLWSFGGWHHTSYLSGEAKNAERTVPKAMVYGVLIVTLVYVLINIAYMKLLNINAIMTTETVAGDALQVVFPYGAKIMAIIIAISVFGTIGIYTMTAPRIYFAMAKDGLFFKGLAKVSKRYNTPANAMLIQAIWAISLLIIWGKFRDLITYVVFMDIGFMLLTGICIFVFRQKYRERSRPVKVPFYPFIPVIFILISIAFVGSTFIGRPEQAWAGLIILGLGIPVYFLFKRKSKSQKD